ncbi:hypothetical protein ACE41H_20305 [Paenibacillus enshidis]|uniref:DUF2283 domain-containing protein n=1 Tax=Paenibacillus enshidis TaxID=1458439 RepID=A0ABV5AYP7_9BACL
MKISVHDDFQMYIYLKNKDVHKHKKSLPDIKCKLLYDSQDNFVGISIMSQQSDTGEVIELPEVGAVEFPMYKAKISQDGNGIIIMFDQETVVHKEVEDECIIDLSDAGITGIEPMPFTHIGGKEIIKPFIIRDAPGVQLPRV